MSTVTLVAQGSTNATAPQDHPVSGVTPDEVFVALVSAHPSFVTVQVRMFGGPNLPRQTRKPNTSIRFAWSISSGYSGAGNITLDADTGIDWEYTILRISGLNEPTALEVSESTWFEVNGVQTGEQTTDPIGTTEAPPALAAGPGQAAVFMGSGPAAGFPGDIVQPATGWVIDHNGATSYPHRASHIAVDDFYDVQYSVKAVGAPSSLSGALLLFGEPAAPPASPEFTGWGRQI